MHCLFRYSLALVLGFAHPGLVAENDPPESFGLGRAVVSVEVSVDGGKHWQTAHLRGPGSQLYHLNPIMSWIVEGDGQVIYKAEPWV